MALFSSQQIPLTPTLDQVEFYAGKFACTRAAWEHGKRAVPYEITLDAALYNILGDNVSI